MGMSTSGAFGDPPSGTCAIHGYYVGSWTCPSCNFESVPSAYTWSLSNPFTKEQEERIREIVVEELNKAYEQTNREIKDIMAERIKGENKWK